MDDVRDILAWTELCRNEISRIVKASRCGNANFNVRVGADESGPCAVLVKKDVLTYSWPLE